MDDLKLSEQSCSNGESFRKDIDLESHSVSISLAFPSSHFSLIQFERLRVEGELDAAAQCLRCNIGGWEGRNP